MKKLAFFIAVLILESCVNRSTPPPPPPPCDAKTNPASACLVIEENLQSAATCCNTKHLTVAQNKSLNYTLCVVLDEDTLSGSQWLYKRRVYDTIPRNQSRQLGCSYLPADCNINKRWVVDTVKYCEIPNSDRMLLPDNSDILFDCRKSCPNCNSFPYSALTPSQQSDANDLYNDLFNSAVSNINSSSDWVSAFFPLNIMPATRLSTFSNQTFESTGNALHLEGELISPVQLANTSDYFQDYYIDIPNVITGAISRKAMEVQVDFQTNLPRFISVTVKLTNGKLRYDIIKHLYVLKARRKIILSGDFICLNLSESNQR